MADFEIGTFGFISITQPPDRPREQLSIVSRAGVNNVAAFKTGTRTEPFQLQSVVDVKASSGTAHVAAAEARFREYESIVGGDPITLKWNGVATDGSYLVLAVANPIIRPALVPIGGLVGGGATLRATWTLIAVT